MSGPRILRVRDRSTRRTSILRSSVLKADNCRLEFPVSVTVSTSREPAENLCRLVPPMELTIEWERVQRALRSDCFLVEQLRFGHFRFVCSKKATRACQTAAMYSGVGSGVGWSAEARQAKATSLLRRERIGRSCESYAGGRTHFDARAAARLPGGDHITGFPGLRLQASTSRKSWTYR